MPCCKLTLLSMPASIIRGLDSKNVFCIWFIMLPTSTDGTSYKQKQKEITIKQTCPLFKK
jgi:hypothetical protein